MGEIIAVVAAVVAWFGMIVLIRHDRKKNGRDD